jgi:hypothetical protein
MYFGTKSYLKSNHYHTPKHPHIAQSDKIGMDLKQQTNRGHGRKRMLPYIPCTIIFKSSGKITVLHTQFTIHYGLQ